MQHLLADGCTMKLYGGKIDFEARLVSPDARERGRTRLLVAIDQKNVAAPLHQGHGDVYCEHGFAHAALDVANRQNHDNDKSAPIGLFAVLGRNRRMNRDPSHNSISTQYGKEANW